MSLPPLRNGALPSAGMSYQRMTASQLSATPCSRLNMNSRSRVAVIMIGAARGNDESMSVHFLP
jgi:hypothetical protein